jgi:hypothetical protein
MPHDPQHASPARLPRRWPILLFALPAAVSIWAGWVGLGQLAGFGIVHPLPGIASSFRINTAITLPVGVEAYGAYALGAWLNAATPSAARTFAKGSAIGSLLLGMLGQVAYHLLAAAHATRAPAVVTVLVACMPVVTLGFGAALTHLLRAGDAAPAGAILGATPGAIRDAAESAIPEPREVPAEVPLKVPAEVPAAVPAREPRRAAPGASKGPDAESARAAWRKSKRGGAPLTDRALGEMFGRSRTWGAARIREAEGGPKLAEAASS